MPRNSINTSPVCRLPLLPFKYPWSVLILIAVITACVSSNTTTKSNAYPDKKQSQKTETSNPSQSDSLRQEAVEDVALARKLVIGKWKWDKTICCSRRPEVEKPDPNDTPEYVVFRQDSSVAFYTGDSLKKKKHFRVKKGALVSNLPELKIEGQRTAILKVTKHQLVLDYSYIDLQTEYYRKVN